MPEGDTIFRTARNLGRALSGQPVTVFRSTYPLLTRFNDDTPITGQLVSSVEARGKWLLIHFSGGGTLATHMLMNGSWHIYRHGERWQQPRFNMRIVIENTQYIAVGFKCPWLKCTPPVAGPRPPLSRPRHRRPQPNFDSAEAALRIQAHSSEEIADVLLHQEVLAGVGNEFKSEICFVTGIHPFCRVAALTLEQIQSVVVASQRLLRTNVLVDSPDTLVTYAGATRRTTHASDPTASVWVYGRHGEPCRRCAEPIRRRIQGPDARVTFWCRAASPCPTVPMSMDVSSGNP